MAGAGRRPHDDGLVAFGERLRQRRRERGITLRQLAREIGVSPSLISQVERDVVRPSVSTLYGIVQVVGGSLDELVFAGDHGPDAVVERHLDDHPHLNPVQSADERATLELSSGVRWERLTTASVPGIDFLHVTYRPGGSSSEAGAPQRHDGHEWGHVLSGRLHVRVGAEDHVLTAGDSISLDSAVPHRLWNADDEDAEAIWFVLGRAPRP